MSILNKINEAIHSSCEITGNAKKVLEEAQEDMTVKLKTTGQYLLYDFERIKGGDVYPFFESKGNEGLKSIADYVIFAEKKQKLYVLIIELKLGRTNPKPQLYATRAFLEFMVKRIAWVKKVSPDVEYRMIGISKNVRKKVSKKIYDENGYCGFSGTELKLDVYLQ